MDNGVRAPASRRFLGLIKVSTLPTKRSQRAALDPVGTVLREAINIELELGRKS